MGSALETLPPELRAAVQRANRSDFVFVNIGANDGVSNDYIYPFLCEYGWRGVPGEPLDARFEELSRNYARFPKVALERAAITTTPRAFHFIRPVAGYDRPWTRQVGTLNHDFLLRSIAAMRDWRFDGPVPPRLEDAVVSGAVPCPSFNALMEKHRIARIDYLSIDAEGSDYEIFCSVDFTRYRPRILVIETGDMQPEQRRDFDARLASLDYVFLVRLDFLTEAFVQRELAPDD